MKAVNIREARQRFSELLDLAEHGEEIVLTRHGAPIARLVPTEHAPRRLPSLQSFRASIGKAGTPSVPLLRAERDAT